MFKHLIGAAAALMTLAGASNAAPLTFDFTTIVGSVFDLDQGVQDNTNPIFATAGTASLSIDSADIFAGSYTAFGSEFTMTHDFGAGPETFTGADDFLIGAQFFFDANDEVVDVFFDVVDDDPFTIVDEDNIVQATIVDFGFIGTIGSPFNLLTLEVQVADDTAPVSAVVPLPASGLLLIGGLGGLALMRRRRR